MNNDLTSTQITKILALLEDRFNKSDFISKKVNFSDVKNRLINNMDKLLSLSEMEATGGEVRLGWVDELTNEYVFVDFAKESPAGRRNCCYDDEALNSRKQFKPPFSALGLASKMGIDLLTEEEYRRLQELGEFDLKTSTWIKTPDKIRKLGGALFCDRRYDTVFTYHNGAESYYSSRGFRGKIKV